MDAHYPLCIVHPGVLSIMYLGMSPITYPGTLSIVYPCTLSIKMPLAWICIFMHVLSWLNLFFIAFSIILTLSTDYKVFRILTVDDGDNKVRWWWLVEEWENMWSCQYVWWCCMRSLNVGYGAGYPLGLRLTAGKYYTATLAWNHAGYLTFKLLVQHHQTHWQLHMLSHSSTNHHHLTLLLLSSTVSILNTL